MYKDSEDYCLVSKLKEVCHHLERAKHALKSGSPQHCEAHLEDAIDDVECAMDYIKGHHDGRSEFITALMDLMPHLKEVMHYSVNEPKRARRY